MTEQSYKIRIRQGEVEIEVEGDKAFVESHIEEFKKVVSKTTKAPSFEESVSEVPKGKTLEGITLAEFYKQKQPEDDIEVALTIGYYLVDRGGKEDFTNKQIKEEADKLGYKLTNPADTLRRAASGKKAYVNKIAKGKWMLTMEGRKLVETGLPKKSER